MVGTLSSMSSISVCCNHKIPQKTSCIEHPRNSLSKCCKDWQDSQFATKKWLHLGFSQLLNSPFPTRAIPRLLQFFLFEVTEVTKPKKSFIYLWCLLLGSLLDSKLIYAFSAEHKRSQRSKVLRRLIQSWKHPTKWWAKSKHNC